MLMYCIGWTDSISYDGFLVNEELGSIFVIQMSHHVIVPTQSPKYMVHSFPFAY